MSEKDEIAALTKAQRRRIARYSCKWCDHRCTTPDAARFTNGAVRRRAPSDAPTASTPTTPQPRTGDGASMALRGWPASLQGGLRSIRVAVRQTNPVLSVQVRRNP